VASQEISGFGTIISRPLFFHWRWYYNFPILPVCGMIVLLLVAPKSNRCSRAWALLIPLGFILILWRLATSMFPMTPVIAQILGFLLMTIALAWCSVWLVGHWLSSRRRILTFLLLCAVMMVMELFSYFCHFSDARILARLSIYYGLSVLSLLLPMMLTPYFCPKKSTPLRFIVAWMLGVCIMIMGLIFCVSALTAIAQSDFTCMWKILTRLLVPGAIFAGMIYLVNLPFLILVRQNSFYRQRFEDIFAKALEKSKTLDEKDIEELIGPPAYKKNGVDVKDAK
jgi:hypothetical protein